jgi:hypothetical protein
MARPVHRLGAVDMSRPEGRIEAGIPEPDAGAGFAAGPTTLAPQV